MVASGTFREDLLFRIRTLVLELPPLRESKEDIRDLVLHYLVKLCEQYGVAMKSFSPEFLAALTAYGWPGNVRELIQALEKAVVGAGDEPVLFPKHLPEHVRIRLAREAVRPKSPPEARPAEAVSGPTGPVSLKDHRDAELARAERDYLASLIRKTCGDIGETCRVSGLSRSRLYTLLKKYRISPSG